MLIKFKLIKFNRCLLFQILEQSELITTNDRDYHKKIYRGIQIDNCKIFSQSFIDINNYDIDNPETNLTCIYLRGNDKYKDKQIVTRYYDSNELRDLEYDKIINALSKLKENLE